MAEPTIICPKCKNEIKLTESLAAPLIESTRADFEKRLAQKDLDVAGREKSIQEREAALSKEKGSLEIQVSQRVQQERGKIAEEEAKKAKLALSNDIEQKAKEVADLQEILKQKDAKLTEAQKKTRTRRRQARTRLDRRKKNCRRFDGHPPTGAEGSGRRIEAESFRKGTNHFFDAEAD